MNPERELRYLRDVKGSMEESLINQYAKVQRLEKENAALLKSLEWVKSRLASYKRKLRTGRYG